MSIEAEVTAYMCTVKIRALAAADRLIWTVVPKNKNTRLWGFV